MDYPILLMNDIIPYVNPKYILNYTAALTAFVKSPTKSLCGPL